MGLHPPYLLRTYNARRLFQQRVYRTGLLTNATHTLKITYTGTKNALSSGTAINLDALDVLGSLVGLTRYEQSDSRLSYAGTWTPAYSSHATEGASRIANKTGLSVTLHFTGSYLRLLATTARSYGKAKITLDSKPPIYLDLYSSSTLYQQKVWSTGVLTYGAHILKLEWTGQRRSNRHLH